MRMKILAVGMIVVMATCTLVWAADETGSSGSGNAGTTIKESIIYTEGIDLDGSPVEETPEESSYPAIIGPAEDMEIDWSDNLVYTQFSAGSMVRVEAAFHNIDDKDNPAVFAARTHLKIEEIDKIGGDPEREIFTGSIEDTLELPDNERMFYSEINQKGLLIYGFNWDTRAPDTKAEAGYYRITFSFEKDCPDGLDCHDLLLTSHAPADHDSPLEAGVDYLINEDHLAQNWCSLDIVLLDKETGGRHET